MVQNSWEVYRRGSAPAPRPPPLPYHEKIRVVSESRPKRPSERQTDSAMNDCRFSCRTMAPWALAGCAFSTSADLRLWMNEMCGGDVITHRQLAGVRVWMAGAQAGDVAYLNADGSLAVQGQGDIEIRRNTV